MYHAGETAFKIAADLRAFGGRLDYVVVDHAVMPCSVDFDLLSLGFGRTGFHLPPVFVLPRERVCFSSVQLTWKVTSGPRSFEDATLFRRSLGALCSLRTRRRPPTARLSFYERSTSRMIANAVALCERVNAGGAGAVVARVVVENQNSLCQQARLMHATDILVLAFGGHYPPLALGGLTMQ